MKKRATKKKNSDPKPKPPPCPFCPGKPPGRQHPDAPPGCWWCPKCGSGF